MAWLTVVPAYGRDYKSAKAVKADWDAGKDFQIQDMSSPDNGRYVSNRDLEGTNIDTVKVRYKRLTQVTTIKV